MKLEEVKAQLPESTHAALEQIWEGLEFAEGMYGPYSTIAYIKMLTLLQCEISNRIFNATDKVKDKL